ncbi:MAG: RimK family alpha-L-glutamate ligase [Promethearchaeota archaeon]
MTKKIFVSIRKNHDVLDKVVRKLKEYSDFEVFVHHPFEDIINLTDILNQLKKSDYLILKASNKISIDILHFAKFYNVPALHDLDTVVTCRSKIALDCRLRQIFEKYQDEFNDFLLPIPNSWVGCINEKNLEVFKEWAKPLLPLVLKSHDQHDKHIRFSFLARTIEEIDAFYERFKDVLYYSIYIQKHINCDDIDRKIYVIGDKVSGVQRESPLAIAIRENLDFIDVDKINKEEFEIPEKAVQLAKILADEINLKLFGFDLIKSLDHEGKYYLIDVNDFPGYRGLKNAEDMIVDYLLKILNF